MLNLIQHPIVNEILNQVQDYTKKHMSYLRILKKSVRTIWKNKFLFIFGFFISLFAIGVNFGFDFKDKAAFGVFIDKVKNFASTYSERAAILFSIVLFVFVALLFFKIVGDIGLIKCANNIDAGRDGADFQFGFKAGIKKFWKMLLFQILLGFILLFVLFLLAVPCLFMFANYLYVPGVILSLFALVIFIPLAAVIYFTRIYGERYLVVDGDGVLKSIKMGANLFLENAKASVMIAFILFLIDLTLIITVVFGLFLIAIPFLAVGFVFSVLFAGLGSVLVVLCILPAIFVTALVFVAFWTTFRSVAWTLTFRQIR